MHAHPPHTREREYTTTKEKDERCVIFDSTQKAVLEFDRPDQTRPDQTRLDLVSDIIPTTYQPTPPGGWRFYFEARLGGTGVFFNLPHRRHGRLNGLKLLPYPELDRNWSFGARHASSEPDPLRTLIKSKKQEGVEKKNEKNSVMKYPSREVGMRDRGIDYTPFILIYNQSLPLSFFRRYYFRYLPT